MTALPIEVHILIASVFLRMQRSSELQHFAERWLNNEDTRLTDENGAYCFICRQTLDHEILGGFCIEINQHDRGHGMAWAFCDRCADRDDLWSVCVQFVREGASAWFGPVIVPAEETPQ